MEFTLREFSDTLSSQFSDCACPLPCTLCITGGFFIMFLTALFDVLHVFMMVSTTTGRTEQVDANMVNEIHIMQMDGGCR